MTFLFFRPSDGPQWSAGAPGLAKRPGPEARDAEPAPQQLRVWRAAGATSAAAAEERATCAETQSGSAPSSTSSPLFS